MATTKKNTLETKPAKKSARKSTTKVTSSTTQKKATAKKTAAQKAQLKSFRIIPDPQPFYEFRITRQTLYWIILISFIIFAQLWILNLQIEVAILLDSLQSQLPPM